MQPLSLKLPVSDYGFAEHAHRYGRVARLMPRSEWDAHYGLVASIEALKRKRNAVVLAHNYQRPEMYLISIAAAARGTYDARRRTPAEQLWCTLSKRLR